MEDEREIHSSIEVGMPAWSPFHGRVTAGMSRRWIERGGSPLNVVLSRIKEDELEARLRERPELDALLARSMNTAAAWGLEAKRRLLGRVVCQAVLDDAEIDESTLIIDVLAQIDAPHVRCLGAISRAEAEGLGTRVS